MVATMACDSDPRLERLRLPLEEEVMEAMDARPSRPTTTPIPDTEPIIPPKPPPPPPPDVRAPDVYQRWAIAICFGVVLIGAAALIGHLLP